MKANELFTKEFLYKEYILNNKSASEISKAAGYDSNSLIYRKLKKFKIPLKNQSVKGKFKKRIIEKLYYKDNLSIRKIAKIFNVSKGAINNEFRRLKIKIKDYNHGYFPTGNNHILWNGHGEISGSFWYNIQFSGKSRNLEFSITIEYIWELFLKQNRKCALSGVELIMISNLLAENKHLHTASLDRIDSLKGYIEGNVQWVHKNINYIKMDFDQKEFIYWCTLVCDYNRGNNISY